MIYKVEEREHSKKSASGSSRWMNCPGCIRLSEGLASPPSSKDARLGTAQHKLVELCIEKKEKSESFIGDTIEVEGVPFDVTEEMAEDAEFYVGYIRELMREKGAQLWQEVAFKLDMIDPDLGGSADTIVLAGSTLNVIDLKYGRKLVAATNNTQLRFYALGAYVALQRMGKTAEAKNLRTIVMTIVQPRAKDAGGKRIRSEVMHIDDLKKWGEEILKPACEATNKPDAPLKAGSWCYFCKAQGRCPEKNKDSMAVCQAEFGVDNQIVLPKIESLSLEQIGKVMSASDALSKWCDAVHAYARSLVEKGEKVPGWKLVRGRSNRKWTDEKSTEKFLVSALGEKAYAKKLIGIPAAEKLVDKELLAGLITKPDGALTLAEESDPREEVTYKTSEFAGSLDFMD